MLVIIDNYDSFVYNLVHFMGELGAKSLVFRNDAIAVKEVLDLNPEAVILSPGPCDPNSAGICLDLVHAAAGSLPILGVCLGHQTIGQAFGADIVRAPTMMHGKRSRIHHTNQGVFTGLEEKFWATRYHSLTVEPNSVPDVLEVTAQTKDGVIMGLAHKKHPIHGVQFHPESIASEFGHAVLANFLTIAGVKPTKLPSD